MTKIITLNANGIRAAAKKGLFEWLSTQDADLICFQETKAQEYQLNDDMYCLPGYQRYFHDAKKAGYSGVAIFTKYKPTRIKVGLGWPEADDEGRYIQVDFPDISIASVYFPSGASGDVRQAVKFDFLRRFFAYLDAEKIAEKRMIFCGDINIAHKAIDLKNWRTNQKTSGFLPEERAWLDEWLCARGFVDCFRALHPDAIEEYTWWSMRQQARAKNVGWRIDYQIATPSLAQSLVKASVYREQHFSDHAPVIVEYDFEII